MHDGRDGLAVGEGGVAMSRNRAMAPALVAPGTNVGTTTSVGVRMATSARVIEPVGNQRLFSLAPNNGCAQTVRRRRHAEEVTPQVPATEWGGGAVALFGLLLSAGAGARLLLGRSLNNGRSGRPRLTKVRRRAGLGGCRSAAPAVRREGPYRAYDYASIRSNG